MSSIFYNMEPRPLNAEMACIIGLNEAIVLQQIHYWLEKNKKKGINFHDGRYWTYSTVQEYLDRDFPWWSYDTVKRTLTRLTTMGLLLKGNYNKMKMDHTIWYAIDYEAWEKLVEEKTKNAIECDDLALEHFALNEEGNLHQSNRADCTNRIEHFALNEEGNLHHAIPEIIQENKKEIKTKRFDNRTHTRNARARAANVSEFQNKINQYDADNDNTNINNFHTYTNTASDAIDGSTAIDINTIYGSEIHDMPQSDIDNIAADDNAPDINPISLVGTGIVDPAELLFDEFWQLYPRQEKRQQAKQAWMQLKPDRKLLDVMANALEYRRQTKQWLAENGRYIPHPANWLKDRRWEEEVDQGKFCPSAQFQARFGNLTVDGKSLDMTFCSELENVARKLNLDATRCVELEEATIKYMGKGAISGNSLIRERQLINLAQNFMGV